MRDLTSALVVAVVCAASAQQAPPRQTFRSGLDVLTIETAVRDAGGKPVTNLQPADFSVRIDGQPRKVLTSRLYGHAAAAAAPAAAAVVAGPVANVDKAEGRAVVIAVDRDSIRAGSERALIETAAKMLDTLGPEDAAAAVSLPGAVSDFTRDHAAVADAVRRMTGTQPVAEGFHYMTWPEALGYERHDTVTIAEVVSRECTETQYCPRELTTQAYSMVRTGRLRAQALMQNLTGVITRLGSIAAPKHLVFISAGIPFDQELVARYRTLAEKAAQSHVALFIVQLDQSTFDASTNGRGPAAQVYGGRETAEGLGHIASITGGQFFDAVGKAGGVFDRIATDINNFYELGVESLAADADGKPHKVDVSVTRPGVTVTAPASTAVPPRAKRSAVEALKAALKEPTDVTELPLAVTTYVTHSADAGKVRVLIAASTVDPAQAPPNLWGSVVMDGDKVVGAVGAAVDAHTTAPWSSTGVIELAPGRYRLRTAIVAGDRVGTLDLPLAAGLRAVGEARASDLIVGVISGGKLEPVSHLVQGTRAAVLVELSASQPLSDLSGFVLLTPADGGGAAARGPLAFRARSDDKSVVLGETTIDLAAVRPGPYMASAILEQGGKPIGRISRRVDVASGK